MVVVVFHRMWVVVWSVAACCYTHRWFALGLYIMGKARNGIVVFGE